MLCDSHFDAFIAGTGAGKTWAGAVRALHEMRRLGRPSRGMVVCPTYTMLRDAVLPTCLEVWGPLVRRINYSYLGVILAGGHHVLMRSADNPDRLRGVNLHWAWIDEAVYCPDGTWEVTIARLRAEGVLGRAWITTTPRLNVGAQRVYPWVYELVRSGALCVHRARTADNPFVAPEYVEALGAQYTEELRRQELEAEWVEFSAGVFRRDAFRITDVAPSGLRWVRYWDLAVTTATASSYTASAAVALDGQGNLYIRDVIRGRWEWPQARRVIIETMLREPETVHGIEDAVHGLAAIQELRTLPELAHVAIVRVRAERDKLARAMPWAARAEAGKVWLVRGPWVSDFLDEVSLFPRGAHDDQVDAVSGGLVMLSRARTEEAIEAWRRLGGLERDDS